MKAVSIPSIVGMIFMYDLESRYMIVTYVADSWIVYSKTTGSFIRIWHLPKPSVIRWDCREALSAWLQVLRLYNERYADVDSI